MSNKGYKKGEVVLIVGSGRRSNAHAELLARFKEHIKDLHVAMVKMENAGRMGAEAGIALSNAFKKFPMPIICPDDMIKMESVDFSKLEHIVLDSFAGQCFDEAAPIPIKAFKKLKKCITPENKYNGRKPIHKQNQTDKWCNKWNKKIKRKL